MQDKEDLCKTMDLLDTLRCLELLRASSDLDNEMTYKQTHALLKGIERWKEPCWRDTPTL